MLLPTAPGRPLPILLLVIFALFAIAAFFALRLALASRGLRPVFAVAVGSRVRGVRRRRVLLFTSPPHAVGIVPDHNHALRRGHQPYCPYHVERLALTPLADIIEHLQTAEPARVFVRQNPTGIHACTPASVY